MAIRTQFIVNSEERYIDKTADHYILVDDSRCRVSNVKFFKNNYTVLDTVISSEEYLKRREYITSLTDRVISYYGKRYNRGYRLDFNDSQWKLILGHWIEPFLVDAYDKYCILSSLGRNVYMIKRDEKLKMDVLQEFGTYISYSSLYQNKVFVKLMELMGMNVVLKHRDIDEIRDKIRKVVEEQQQTYIRRCKLFKKNPRIVIDRFRKKLSRLESEKIRNGEILVVQSRMQESMEEELQRRSKGRIVFVSENFFKSKVFNIVNSVEINKEIRNKVIKGFAAENEFERHIDILVREFIPKSVFEAIPGIVSEARKVSDNWKFRKIYHSACMSELFLTCCALMRSRKIPICDIQHSAVYGNIYCFGFNEYNMFDRFLTWGWKPVGINKSVCEIRPVAMSRLPMNKDGLNVKIKNKILLSTGYPMQSDGGCGMTFGNYIKEEKEFIDELDEEYRRKLVIRTSVNSELSDLYLWCRKKYPYIQFESLGDKSFTESLLESELLVCDYYGSPHIEALMLDRPFVMFSGQNITVENPGAKSLMDELKEIGLYSTSGRAMARTICKHKDIRKWLEGDKITDVLERYKNEMTGVNRGIVDSWEKEFLGD